MCNYSHGEVLLVAQEAVRVLLAQEACGSVVAPGSVVAWAGAPGAGGLWQRGAPGSVVAWAGATGAGGLWPRGAPCSVGAWAGAPGRAGGW